MSPFSRKASLDHTAALRADSPQETQMITQCLCVYRKWSETEHPLIISKTEDCILIQNWLSAKRVQHIQSLFPQTENVSVNVLQSKLMKLVWCVAVVVEELCSGEFGGRLQWLLPHNHRNGHVLILIGLIVFLLILLIYTHSHTMMNDISWCYSVWMYFCSDLSDRCLCAFMYLPLSGSIDLWLLFRQANWNNKHKVKSLHECSNLCV